MGLGPANLMKCCHTIDGSLPPCLSDNGGSHAPRPIGAAGSGGLGLALPEGGGIGSLRAPNPGRALTSI